MSEFCTGFEQARTGLLNLKPMSSGNVFVRLEVLKIISVSVQIIKEFDELQLEDFQPIEESDLDDFDCPVIDDALNAIYGKAPFEMEMVDFLAERYLIPESMGYPMSWDQFFEICSEPEQYPVYEVFLFFSCLGFGEDDSFNKASQEYGWGVEYPPSNNKKNLYLDGNLFVEKLRAAGLDDFITAIEVYEYSTGNAYFDVNLYDEMWLENFDLPDFSVEGCKALITEWEEAQEIETKLQRAEEHFKNDRSSVAKLLLDLWVSSLKRRPDENEKPKTLIEIFTEDEELEEGEEYDDFDSII